MQDTAAILFLLFFPDAPIKLDGVAINLVLRLLKVNDAAAAALNAGTPVFQGECIQGVDEVRVLRRNQLSTPTSVKYCHRGPIIQAI